MYQQGLFSPMHKVIIAGEPTLLLSFSNIFFGIFSTTSTIFFQRMETYLQLICPKLSTLQQNHLDKYDIMRPCESQIDVVLK